MEQKIVINDDDQINLISNINNNPFGRNAPHSIKINENCKILFDNINLIYNNSCNVILILTHKNSNFKLIFDFKNNANTSKKFYKTFLATFNI